MSILAIAANEAKASKPPGNMAATWTRPAPRQVKLNVDVTFFAETCAGATSVVIHEY
jgi:hypothetical protein